MISRPEANAPSEPITFWETHSNVHEVRATACNAVLLNVWEAVVEYSCTRPANQWQGHFSGTANAHLETLGLGRFGSALLATVSPMQDTSWQLCTATSSHDDEELLSELQSLRLGAGGASWWRYLSSQLANSRGMLRKVTNAKASSNSANSAMRRLHTTHQRDSQEMSKNTIIFEGWCRCMMFSLVRTDISDISLK